MALTNLDDVSHLAGQCVAQQQPEEYDKSSRHPSDLKMPQIQI